MGGSARGQGSNADHRHAFPCFRNIAVPKKMTASRYLRGQSRGLVTSAGQIDETFPPAPGYHPLPQGWSAVVSIDAGPARWQPDGSAGNVGSTVHSHAHCGQGPDSCVRSRSRPSWARTSSPGTGRANTIPRRAEQPASGRRNVWKGLPRVRNTSLRPQ
jgi:hypothetical protein